MIRKLFAVIAMAAAAVLTAGNTVAAAGAPAEPKGDDIPRIQSAFLRWNQTLLFYNSVAECEAGGAQGRQAGRWLAYRCVVNPGIQLETLAVFVDLGVTGAIRNADGRCLDIPGGDDDNGTSVRLINCNRTAAQRWTFEGTGLDNIGRSARSVWTSRAVGPATVTGCRSGRATPRPPRTGCCPATATRSGCATRSPAAAWRPTATVR